MSVPYRDALLNPSPPTSTSKWGPYSGAGDFGTSMVIILVALFLSFILALIFVALICLILSSRRRHPLSSSSPDVEKQASPPKELVLLPTLSFSAGTKLAGAASECAVCLTEFTDGDSVRVLPACNHGFHVRCIEEWLLSQSSCPTCRRSCHVAGPPSPEKSAAGGEV